MIDKEKSINLGLVALESATNPFQMVSPVLKNQLQNILDKTSNDLQGVAKTFMQFDTYLPVFFHDTSVINEVEKKPYSDMIAVNIPVPAGFVGKLDAYVTELSFIYSVFTDIVETTLNPADDYISMIIGHPEKIGSLFEEEQYKKIKTRKADMEAFRKMIAPMFSNDSSKEVYPFGKVFSRNTDFKLYCSHIKNLEKQYRNRELAKVSKMCEQISMKTDLLYTRMKQGKVTTLSNRTAGKIADLMYELALEVEFYAGVLNMIQIALQNYKNIIHYCGDLIKND